MKYVRLSIDVMYEAEDEDDVNATLIDWSHDLDNEFRFASIDASMVDSRLTDLELHEVSEGLDIGSIFSPKKAPPKKPTPAKTIALDGEDNEPTDDITDDIT